MTRRAGGLAVAALAGLAWIAFLARTGERAVPETSESESPRSAVGSVSRTPGPRAEGVVEEEAVSGASITGAVVDPEGLPVPGARVVAIADDAPTAPAMPAEPAGGDDGRFEVGGLDPAIRYDLVADAPRFAPGTLRSIAPGSDVALALEPGATLRGVVRDLAERPIAGARVTWRAIVHGARWERSAESGSDGAYRLEALPTWRSFMNRSLLMANLVASAPGYAEARLDSVMIDRGRPELEKDVYLSRPGRVTGRVFDAETDLPLPGAQVRLLPTDDELTYFGGWDVHRRNPFAGEPLAESVADGEGRFEWEGVGSWGVHTPGSKRFGLASLEPQIGEAVATAAGYASGAAGVSTPDAGATVEVEIRCWPAAVVTGRVVDESERPLEGVEVAASNPDCRPRPSANDAGARSFTDSDGRYRLDGVPARRGTLSAVALRARGGEASVPLRAGETVAAPDIVVASRPRLLVRVIDIEGRPVRGAAVSESVFQSPRGRTGAEGLFELEAFVREAAPMPPVRVWVRAEGYGAEVSDEATPSAVEPTPSVTVRLGPEHRIRGRVVYASGKPVESARILVALAKAPPTEVFIADDGSVPAAAAEWLRSDSCSEPDGTFEVRSLPPGPYHVQVRRYSRHAKPESERVVAENVPTDASDLRLVLADPGDEELRVPIEGTVRDRETGELLVRIRVALRRPSPFEKRHAVAVAPGRFRFDAIEPGVYDLEVGARGYATVVWPGVVVTAAGADRALDVRLDRGATVRGAVRTTTGEPLVAAMLFLNGGRSVLSDVAPIGRDGAYEAVGLERGARYALWVLDDAPDGLRRHWCPAGSNALAVPADADVIERDVVVAPAGSCGVSLYGTALYPSGGDDGDDAGAPEGLVDLREAARLEIVASDGRVAWEKAGIVSPLHWVALPDGEYVVRLHAPGLPPVERSVAVRRGVHVNVSLAPE